MGTDDEAAKPSRSVRRHEHHSGSGTWPPAGSKAPPQGWNNKTMHHPATRIGEIKHGKS